MISKISKKILLLLFIIMIGGLGGIIADRYIFPYLSTSKLFAKYAFLKKSTEDVTVINRTEQVIVKEDSSVTKISAQVSNAVVNIVSYPDASAKALAKKIGAIETGVKNGTGVIVTSDGLVMTYLSAINPTNSKYKILAADGNAYDAELQGIDTYSNLVFLKINASNLPVLPFGNSDETTAGEKIIAIGNSFGSYSNRYALGLVSDFNAEYNIAGKSLSFSDKLEGVFEDDFFLTAQYTGGPVLDYSGQIIGIAGSVSQNGGEKFFILPANKVKKVIDRAIAKEINRDAALGLYYVSLTKTYALSNNLSTEKGALVYSPTGQTSLTMLVGSPAQKAGLKINDIITAVGGQTIEAQKNLSDLLYQYKAGESVELTVLRDGQEIKLPVQL